MTARRERKQVLLRLDPAVYEALARWASDELRSANSQIEFLLRRALAEAGRLPDAPSPLPRRGRPPKRAAPPEGAAAQEGPASAAGTGSPAGRPPADPAAGGAAPSGPGPIAGN
ncbi:MULTISPECIES: hypothetical protein [Streptomyces]|uniref:Uncharacterized protein n=2 Tax=Streptomyces TaxID=1883 RepID=A0A1D8G5T0_9ACTN|nr:MULTISPECIES: hypothetical protein [Streptomyces]AOT60815.1 hypothetical protein A4G23_03690 [Streptomyces rubrolavendulae]KAF0649428.1 hypothetical protein K701_12640 [Streptomyces fradiae ATCC 10745 = DSM 40063]OSY51691.1 hypothetical protein BG846_02623 [Streptomyces fradiae ATCC 10745 = DSM 40063]QEV13885.1 hypothetical protein CP974_19965 [Streptomyces fradiae ATCC 10745 = DSM 40063]